MRAKYTPRTNLTICTPVSYTHLDVYKRQLCILAAAPIAAAGFLSYDGLPFEKFVIIVLESAILYSGWRVWKTELRPKQKGKVKKIAFK